MLLAQLLEFSLELRPEGALVLQFRRNSVHIGKVELTLVLEVLSGRLHGLLELVGALALVDCQLLLLLIERLQRLRCAHGLREGRLHLLFEILHFLFLLLQEACLHAQRFVAALERGLGLFTRGLRLLCLRARRCGLLLCRADSALESNNALLQRPLQRLQRGAGAAQPLAEGIALAARRSAEGLSRPKLAREHLCAKPGELIFIAAIGIFALGEPRIRLGLRVRVLCVALCDGLLCDWRGERCQRCSESRGCSAAASLRRVPSSRRAHLGPFMRVGIASVLIVDAGAALILARYRGRLER